MRGLTGVDGTTPKLTACSRQFSPLTSRLTAHAAGDNVGNFTFTATNVVQACNSDGTGSAIVLLQAAVRGANAMPDVNIYLSTNDQSPLSTASVCKVFAANCKNGVDNDDCGDGLQDTDLTCNTPSQVTVRCAGSGTQVQVPVCFGWASGNSGGCNNIDLWTKNANRCQCFVSTSG